MKIVNLLQGSQEWHAHRAQHFNASDAPAMMSCSPYKTRDELIAELATGVTPEVGAAQQRIFDAGHQFEALARPLAEEIIGEDLYPVVGADGKYSASFDGLTMLEEEGFEHKSLNAALREAMTEGCTGADLPLQYQVQMEQQAMVSGCERILFMASKWETDRDTGETSLIEERHCWYTPNLELRAQIVAGWEQLEQDVAGYVVPGSAPIPVVAAVVTALPAVFAQVTGSIAIKDNLPAFEVALRDFIEHRLIRSPETDQDFADLDLQIKALKGAEAALDAVEEQTLSQVETVAALKRTKEMLHKMARDNRLAAEKLLATRKEQIKLERVQEGRTKLTEHIAALNTRIGKPYMPSIPADFPGVVKGKRNIDSLIDAVNSELARAKIAANEVADRIQVNLATLRELAIQHAFLFADTAQIVLKPTEDCTTLVKARIAEHQAAEASRLEAEREKIRAEEAEKLRLEAEAKERAEAKQKADAEAAAAAAEREAKRKAEEVEAAAARGRALQAAIDAEAAIAAAHKEEALPAPLLNDLSAVATHVRDEAIATVDANQVISAAKNSAPAADTEEIATMTLGQINTLIAPLKVDAAGLADLGFTPSATVKAAKHLPASDVPKILAAMVRHLQGLMVAA